MKTMSTQEEQREAIGRVMRFLREWDRGDGAARSRILNTFIAQNQGKTYYELEADLALGASLFLARLTTWMRLTYPLKPLNPVLWCEVISLSSWWTWSLSLFRYMFGAASVGLQLRAVSVFLSASSRRAAAQT